MELIYISKKKQKQQPKVVQAPLDVSHHIDDLITGASMLHDAFMELCNSEKVASFVTILETALANANRIQEVIREEKMTAGVKDTSKYFGYYDIPLEETISDIPSKDTEYGVGSPAERAGKVLLRVYSQMEKPTDPVSNPFRDGGSAIILGRGSSIPQTKGNRLYASNTTVEDFVSLVNAMSQDTSRNLWGLFAASYVFNKQKRVTTARELRMNTHIDDLEELDLSALEE